MWSVHLSPRLKAIGTNEQEEAAELLWLLLEHLEVQPTTTVCSESRKRRNALPLFCG
jgi:hypothetical protein